MLFALLQLTVPSIQSFGTSESTLNHRKPSKLWILFFRNKQKETTFFGNSLELQDILSDNPSSTMHQLPITTQSTSIRYRGGYCEEIITPSAEPASIWQTASRRLVTLANVASLLCVIDCTVLPIVTILFPLLGMAAPGQMEWLHEFGHSVAIYFVLPGTPTMSKLCSIFQQLRLTYGQWSPSRRYGSYDELHLTQEDETFDTSSRRIASHICRQRTRRVAFESNSTWGPAYDSFWNLASRCQHWRVCHVVGIKLRVTPTRGLQRRQVQSDSLNMNLNLRMDGWIHPWYQNGSNYWTSIILRCSPVVVFNYSVTTSWPRKMCSYSSCPLSWLWPVALDRYFVPWVSFESYHCALTVWLSN